MNVTDRAYALELDKNDPLAHFKSQFVVTDPEMCYLDGNSLGRLPKETISAVNNLMTEWGSEVVTGWGHWVDEAQPTGDLLGQAALGAGPGQILVCDTTSVNFYQLCLAAIHARPGRKTIITDAANFPTDRYILDGIAKQFGLKLILIQNEDPAVATHERITTQVLAPYLNDDVALVTLQVIQYRSGARTDIKSITDQVRAIGALVVWDASHAVGAIELNLDANGVDLCVGCTYKYGNSGPGSPAWLYVSKKIQKELQVPIQGWFAQDAQFEMGPVFERAQNIRGFQIASPSLIGIRCVQTAFSMIKEAGIDAIAHKAAVGTQMMIDLYDSWLAPLGFVLNTSRDPKERGGHISLVHQDAAQICVAMREISNVIPDYRTPNSIRLAISPLPTSFVEVWDGFARTRDLVASGQYKTIKEGGSRVT
ncbi:MAG: aminotransferase class V-fold PLP-dependent enzyme [Actinobacteria bacterium]|nr:aminotransferase class V-fold PLP-dependent enzyme [Actinomycetota bacterium]NDA45329.1 aminotransferase class V-fold PLP-dependent enzyme [Actinomycetota bacterium]NDC17361.1 aminotransferase class V-fold PLP-dependent enzyme [Actinomycetota bacterium]NDF89629.1 aminotransferase class V-fold PLP-dependent enzyme [Actinomycetota bacterium]